MEALSKSEQNFITNLKDFYSLETSVGYTYNEVDDQYNAITYSHILSFLDDNNFDLD